MNMKNLSVRRLVRCAVIAAVYVVVCLVLAPFSYGAVQVRVAEALCLLPVFGAEYRRRHAWLLFGKSARLHRR